MKTIAVETDSKSYAVKIGGGLLKEAGALAASLLKPGIAAIITDTTVDALYADGLSASLEAAGFETVKYAFPAGEASKNAETLISILNFLADNRLSRSDAVFALGGGVVGDIAGLAAAMYMRGVRLVQLPTTLLAAVDSSVGGKTAINLNAGKNLAGAFYQPDIVICDTDTLSTLPAAQLADGCAEVIKYAVIHDADILNVVKPPVGDRLTDLIARCVEIKRDVVGADERENGERQLLNFGHTFGHAVEKCSGYTVSHGSAVAIGMVLMTRAAEKTGLCRGGCLNAIISALVQYALPVSTGFGEEELFEALLSDKKRVQEHITLVVPRSIGSCERMSVTLAEARRFLRLGLED